MDMKQYRNTELTNPEYHSMPAISSSQVVDFDTSPFLYWNNHINPFKPEKPTPDYFAIGTVTHALVLEPELFDQQFIVAPKVDRRTKAGKQEWQDFLDAAGEREVVKKEHMDIAKGLRDAVSRNSFAMNLLMQGMVEHSYFWNGLKVRADHIIVNDDTGKILITDLKTTDSINPRKFSYKVKDLYLFRAAFYKYVVQKFYPDYEIDFSYIAVSKEDTPRCTVFEVPRHSLDGSLPKVQEAIDGIIEMNDRYGEEPWPDTTPQLLMLEV